MSDPGPQTYRQPIQPIDIDERGALRFRKNTIVCRLLDEGGIDLNDIAMWDAPQTDREQFAMLIGYSLDGFGSLSYASDETYEAAVAMVEGAPSEAAARLAECQRLLARLRKECGPALADLFGKHPDDFSEKG